MLHQIDHLLYGTSNLEAGIQYIHDLTGVKPILGGSHPGLGTHNALLGLGDSVYLEIIAPDLKQKVDHIWMNLDKLEKPRLFRWAAATNDTEQMKSLALDAGIDIGEIKSGSRYKPDGTLLEWTLSDPNVDTADGLIPFFIDWGLKGNPSPDLPQGCKLTRFEARHPRHTEIMKKLKCLQLDLPVVKADQAQLVAVIDTPNGDVILC